MEKELNVAILIKTNKFKSLTSMKKLSIITFTIL